MPDYYSDGNSVLGPAPVQAPPRPPAPNALLAGVILAACAAAVAAMIYFQPGLSTGGGGLARAVVYVVAEYEDKSKLAATGYISAADGTVLTCWSPFGEKVAAPKRFSVYVDVGQPSQKELPATLVKSGSSGAGTAGEDRFAGNWAVLKIGGDARAWPCLGAEPGPVQAGAAVRAAGVERNGTQRVVDDKVAAVVGGDKGVQRFSLIEKATPAMVGGPVLDARSGRVLGLNVGVMTLTGTDGKEAPAATWVLPLSRIPGLGAGQAGGS